MDGFGTQWMEGGGSGGFTTILPGMDEWARNGWPDSANWRFVDLSFFAFSGWVKLGWFVYQYLF